MRIKVLVLRITVCWLYYWSIIRVGYIFVIHLIITISFSLSLLSSFLVPFSSSLCILSFFSHPLTKSSTFNPRNTVLFKSWTGWKDHALFRCIMLYFFSSWIYIFEYHVYYISFLSPGTCVCHDASVCIICLKSTQILYILDWKISICLA